MGTIMIYAGKYSIVVPFTKTGIDACRVFLDVLADLLEAEETGGQ